MKPAAIILMGGKSRRMGQDKATLAVNDLTFLKRCIEDMRPVCSKIYVLAAARQEVECVDGVELFRDRMPYEGPASALVRFARENNEPWLLVRAVDMPFASAAEFMQSVDINAMEKCDVVMASHDGRDQPLFALYRRKALAAVNVVFPCSMFDVLDQLRLTRLPFTGTHWKNFNRPDQLPGSGTEICV